MANPIGQQLGNYRVLRLLGRGAFAEVYLGEHLYLKNLAALKVLHTSLQEQEVDRFQAEARMLARLLHPQIVRVLDFYVEQATPVLVMDYASGGTLPQSHPPSSYLSLQATVAYVKQMASALQYAHNANIIHRDVKPENMLLGASQGVLLSDFGISLFAPSHEQLRSQELAGTIPYMAPEQLQGTPGFASDQYALGVVAYEWLCGARPFEGSAPHILAQHLQAAPPPLREKDASLPEAVEAVVLKALAKEPQQRYVSVHLFAQALERASQGPAPPLDLQGEHTRPLDPFSAAAPAPPRRVFLSATPSEAAFVAQLKADLQVRDVAVAEDTLERSPRKRR